MCVHAPVRVQQLACPTISRPYAAGVPLAELHYAYPPNATELECGLYFGLEQPDPHTPSLVVEVGNATHSGDTSESLYVQAYYIAGSGEATGAPPSNVLWWNLQVRGGHTCSTGPLCCTDKLPDCCRRAS